MLARTVTATMAANATSRTKATIGSHLAVVICSFLTSYTATVSVRRQGKLRAVVLAHRGVGITLQAVEGRALGQS